MNCGTCRPSRRERPLWRSGKRVPVDHPCSRGWNARDGVPYRVGIADRFGLLQMPDDFVIPLLQHVVGLKRERPAAAGGVHDFQPPQNLQALPPVGGIVRGDPLLRVALGDAELHRGELGESLVDQLFDRVLHDAAGQFGGV